jgi:hypothetical protein
VLKSLANFLIDQRAHAEASAVVDDLVRDPANDDPGTLAFAGRSWSLCAALAWQDQKLPKDRRDAAVRSCAERARDVLRRANDAGSDTGATERCWFLVSCPLEEFRDAALATQIARQLIAKRPTDPDPSLMLGCALYRSGDFKGAVTAFKKRAEPNHGRSNSANLFLAMAHWRLDQKAQARQCFERCVGSMAGKRTDATGDLVRAEAAALLGLPERGPPSSVEQARENKKD